jgi:hypothetical protein
LHQWLSLFTLNRCNNPSIYMKTKQLALSGLFALSATAAGAQITITSADMPVLGDMPRYSYVDATTQFNLSNTGANIAWDYSALSAVGQRQDKYVTVSASGYAQSGIPSAAYGFMVADTLEFSGAPASLRNVYNFFELSASSFSAVGFAGTVSGAFTVPVSAPYTDKDEWLSFPCTYNRYDSTTFRFTASVSIFGSIMIKGYRKTRVDGWGTIVTPKLTTATPVLRVRSEVVEIDSVDVAGTKYGFPRHTVEYQWWANGLRYPALWITTDMSSGTEVPSAARYWDPSPAGIGRVQGSQLTQLQIYPNPAAGQNVRVKVPQAWKQYETALYDAAGRMLNKTAGSDVVATQHLPAGKYTLVVRSGDNYGIAQFVK